MTKQTTTVQAMTIALPDKPDKLSLTNAMVELAKRYMEAHGTDPNIVAFNPDDFKYRDIAEDILTASTPSGGSQIKVVTSGGTPPGLMAMFRFDGDEQQGNGGGSATDADVDEEVIALKGYVPGKPGILANEDRPFLSIGEYVSVSTLEPEEIIAAVLDATALWRAKHPDKPEPRHVGLPNNLDDATADRIHRYFYENRDIHPWYNPSDWRVGKHNVAVGINMRG